MKKKKIIFYLKFFLKETTLISFNVFVIFVFLAIAGFLYLMVKTPLGKSLYSRDIPQTSAIYDRSGEHILYEMFGEENRKILSHDEIPNTIRVATIATEDSSFYSHHGIAFLSIIRAFKNNIEANSIRQGGSTITQQLARNAFLGREKTIRRKILEIVYAVKIEKKYTKDEILDAYLNEVPYGSNAYGIETASQTFFGKSAKNLSLDEAAFLAALPKAPTFYSPYGKNTDKLLTRQKEILLKIFEMRIADEKIILEALKVDTIKKIIPLTRPINSPHFVFYLREILEKKYGEKNLKESGLKIYSTLDWEKQKLAEKIIEANDPALKKYGASNVALVAIDPQNGQILAMAGSKDYFDSSIDGKVNVTTRPRQPGSSFKPIVYAKAFEKGFEPETLVLDAETNFGPDGSGLPYIPRNYDGKFHGIISMRQALAMSLNIPAIKTLREVSLDDAIEMAHRLGITTLNDRNRYGLSLVIGGGEVTLLDETSAFSVFANDGKRNPTNPILKITNNKEEIVAESKSENLPVLDPQVARKINSILSDNDARTPIFGRNNKLFISGRTVAAKTGTTQEFRDAWTVGYTPNIAVGVWAGNNNGKSMRAGADGSYVTAPIWNQFMSEVLQSYPQKTFLAYEKEDLKKTNLPKIAYELPKTKEKIVYYKIASGKKISEKKAKKMDASEIRTKVEIVLIEENNNDNVNPETESKTPVF